MKKTAVFSLLLLFSLTAQAKCKSFSFGVNSIDKNEFAFFECSSKQVFQNSDLFNSKKSNQYFIGESILKQKINYKRVNKILKRIVKKSTKTPMKKMFDSHNFHLTLDKQSYQIDLKHFNILKGVLGVLVKKSKPKNGVLVRGMKVTRLKNKTKVGPVDALKLKSMKNHYFFHGLYWKK